MKMPLFQGTAWTLSHLVYPTMKEHLACNQVAIPVVSGFAMVPVPAVWIDVVAPSLTAIPESSKPTSVRALSGYFSQFLLGMQQESSHAPWSENLMHFPLLSHAQTESAREISRNLRDLLFQRSYCQILSIFVVLSSNHFSLLIISVRCCPQNHVEAPVTVKFGR